MGKRKIPTWQSPSVRYERDLAPVLKQARKAATKRERREEYAARQRAIRAETAESTGRRVVRDILRHPSPAGLNRLLDLCRDLRQPAMVRAEAARAILVLATREEPHGNEGRGV